MQTPTDTCTETDAQGYTHYICDLKVHLWSSNSTSHTSQRPRDLYRRLLCIRKRAKRGVCVSRSCTTRIPRPLHPFCQPSSAVENVGLSLQITTEHLSLLRSLQRCLFGIQSIRKCFYVFFFTCIHLQILREPRSLQRKQRVRMRTCVCL